MMSARISRNQQARLCATGGPLANHSPLYKLFAFEPQKDGTITLTAKFLAHTREMAAYLHNNDIDEFEPYTRFTIAGVQHIISEIFIEDIVGKMEPIADHELYQRKYLLYGPVSILDEVAIRKGFVPRIITGATDLDVLNFLQTHFSPIDIFAWRYQ